MEGSLIDERKILEYLGAKDIFTANEIAAIPTDSILSASEIRIAFLAYAETLFASQNDNATHASEKAALLDRHKVALWSKASQHLYVEIVTSILAKRLGRDIGECDATRIIPHLPKKKEKAITAPALAA